MGALTLQNYRVDQFFSVLSHIKSLCGLVCTRLQPLREIMPFTDRSASQWQHAGSTKMSKARYGIGHIRFDRGIETYCQSKTKLVKTNSQNAVYLDVSQLTPRQLYSAARHPHRSLETAPSPSLIRGPRGTTRHSGNSGKSEASLVGRSR
jgi:hypothetical protein